MSIYTEILDAIVAQTKVEQANGLKLDAINANLEKLIALQQGVDIELSGTVDKPVNQGSVKVMDKNKFLLHAALAVTPMLDDQKALMHVLISQGGAQLPGLPAGASLTWTPADANITVNPGVGITGAPSTDPLAAVAFGVHGVGADTSITVTMSPANPDGTVPTATFPFHITVDPLELDITLAGTVDTPVAQ